MGVLARGRKIQGGYLSGCCAVQPSRASIRAGRSVQLEELAAVLLVHVLGRERALSAWGAGLYISARLIYLLLYAAGIPLLRSLVWNVAFAGIVLLLLAAVWRG
jgi:uncharacterized MAPEG superfamily protein